MQNKPPPYGQDLPPPEGFPKIPYQRSIPTRGPPGWILLFGAAGVIGVGLYYARLGNRTQWELDREQLQAKLHLEPFLQAEKDRFYLRAREATRRIEKTVMKNIPDWKMHEPVYHGSTNYVPEYVIIPDTSSPVYPALQALAKDHFRP